MATGVNVRNSQQSEAVTVGGMIVASSQAVPGGKVFMWSKKKARIRHGAFPHQFRALYVSWPARPSKGELFIHCKNRNTRLLHNSADCPTFARLFSFSGGVSPP